MLSDDLSRLEELMAAAAAKLAAGRHDEGYWELVEAYRIVWEYRYGSKKEDVK